MSAPSTFLLKLTLRLIGSLKARVDKNKIRQRGFVLPIAILIVLVLSLVTVGLLTRSTQRNVQTQVERAGQTVNRQLNSAIDRARAKIDLLIRDRRLPVSTPTDAQFSSALINDGGLIPAYTNSPYILPDETQFVIRSNFQVEDPKNPGQSLSIPVQAPAWWFLADTDNNGTDDSVTVYTILSARRAGGAAFEDNLTDTERAHRLMIRSGPLQGSALVGCTDSLTGQTVNPNIGDWFQFGSVLYKPFQVYAVTLPIQGADSTTRAISALQFQQDRRRELMNKWGMFTRADLELFFTPGFNWNGAIYSSGSLFFRYGQNNLFRAFMISSEHSCFYMPVENSEITTLGELVAGAIGYSGQQVSDTLSFDVHSDQPGVAPQRTPRLNNLNFDSVQNTTQPRDVAVDPLALHLFGQTRNRGEYSRDEAGWSESPVMEDETTSELEGRIKTRSVSCPPYVDDTYRADNRFGPKASYDRPPVEPDENIGCRVPTFTETFNSAAGSPIPETARNNQDESLTEDNPPPGALSEVGLDGYWERRSRVEGLRVIVGQRLELTRTDSLPLPLVPPTDDITGLQPIFISNEARQRLTLRDNPAAVQATAVYHYSQQEGRFPVACLATVAHPGSVGSLKRASTFPSGNQATQLGINFFTGQGTNVWEYDPTPMKDLLTPGTPLWTALTNLARFAGDPDGAFPPRQEPGRIHPDPFITAFGNFSELRRIIDNPANLSLADESTLQTAGCMLGMLADNILRIQQAANAGDFAAQILWNDIQASRRGERYINSETQLPVHRFYLPLRYIFPTENFDWNDPLERERLNAYGSEYGFLQPTTYQAVNDLAAIALTPRSGINNWTLPHAQESCPPGNSGPNSNQFELIQIGDQCHRVPFKDSVFYDGREAMPVRSLNVDLALLTNNVNGQFNGLIAGDTWLPAGIEEGHEGGIFYAFREDAVREDAIARPPLASFANYQNQWQNANGDGNLGSAGIMNAGQLGRDQVNNQTVWDPPVAESGLSPKPVDYYADPERRPYGFRLRNGAILRRGGLDPNQAVFGLSFISDNPVYIQGDFNLHQTENRERLEEFKTKLRFGPDGLYENFYGRQDEDERFARAAKDLWRPTDVIGDSVNILSASFCDGSLDDGFVQDGTLNGGGSAFVANRDYMNGRASAPRRKEYYGCSGPNIGNTSFTNQALVIRGNNWPAQDPNNPGAGVRRFDNTGGAQDLGNNTNQPGHPDVFARDTVFARFDNNDADPINDDKTVGGGIPQVRQLRAPDVGYASFGTRISALGNPVLDTSRWLLIAPPGPCPVPNGSGLLAEYYNGWIANPRDRYQRDTGFNQTAAAGPLPSAAQDSNLPYLRSVRWPDPIYPESSIPENIGAPSGAPACNQQQRWACVRDAINDVSKLAGFARSGGSFPDWGGFYYQFGSSGPFKQRLYNNDSCNGDLRDILNPRCRLSVPLFSPPNTWPPTFPFTLPDPSLKPQDRGDFFWLPTCGEPNTGNLVIDADDIGYSYVPIGYPHIGINLDNPSNPTEFIFNPNQFNHLRSCWRRGSAAGNSNGNDYFVVRWVGELYPRYPGLVNYNLNTDDGGRLIIRRKDGSNATFRNASAGSGTFLNNLGPNAVGVETWQDSGNATSTLRVELECADPGQPSPYLVEIQAYENQGSAFVRFSTNPDGQSAENYDLRYLKPIKPVNKPCEPDPNKQVTDITVQRNCDVTCAPIWSDWQPACNPRICTPQTIRQTRTATLPTGCPGTPPPPQEREHTCRPQFTCGSWSNWTPACTVDKGGQQINQERTRNCTSSFCGSYTERESRTVTCQRVCNYDYGPWNPPDCSNVTVPCGQTRTVTKTRSGTLRPGSSPGCQQTVTQSGSLTCSGKPCGPGLSAPDSRIKSPFGEWVASKPNTLDLRPVWEREAEPEPEEILSVETVASSALQEGVTIALSDELSPVLEVKAAKAEPHWPSFSEAMESLYNWMFGEPAYAARQGLAGSVLPSDIAKPGREPGIRPAEEVGTPIPPENSPVGSDNWARRLRRQLLNPDGLIRCGEEEVNPNGGFWVPGVFRPNFNTTFKYTAYTGDSSPSTYKVISDPEDPNRTLVVDRDPLFGIGGSSGNIEVQPQMALNPYARVNLGQDQNYNPTAQYKDGYFIDNEGAEKIQNGLCFYVKLNNGAVQVWVDRNGNGDGGQDWVDVEPFTRHLNQPPTGFAGNNPVLGVILDEVTRRPIPIPGFQELASAELTKRRRNDDGSNNYQLQEAELTRVNAIAIGGVIPPRLGQTNGGMHNFLRLNELWRNKDLFFSGSMIQLNYSTYATGPFLQLSFEPPQLRPDPTNVLGYDYYYPPNRRFGYDVGLQIARRPSPVSARFQNPSNTRTEFLRELDPQDPYVRRLRCALQQQPVNLDPAARIDGCDEEFN
ncbi:MAG: hormogonium polysaccharide biosynthesis protein HpsA [Cyanobacteriota bacterium]